MTFSKQAFPDVGVSRLLRVRQWRGPVDYAEAYEVQQQTWSRVLNGEISDTLLVLSHPPTITFGKSGKVENLLASREELARRGIGVFFTDRGGDVTYHGPGQVVAYPIIDLRRRGRDIHRYVHELEEVVIRTLEDMSLSAHRDEGHVGVWVADEKIAAIGVRVRKWVTMHGLALNVDPVMEHFSFINPCGITDRRVTSIARLLSRHVALEEVAGLLVDQFGDVFGVGVEWV